MNNEIYSVEKIGERTYRIDEYGRDNCYLLLGDERALLIDCSIGTGDIKAVVEGITNLPLIVAATHAHGDHTGAGYQFKEIFVPKGECNLLFKTINKRKHRRNLISNRMKKAGITGENIKGNNFFAKWIPFEEGKVFDLGGRTVKAVSTRGHSPDGMTFLDEGEKKMFTGDNIGPVLLMKVIAALPLSAWLPGAEKTLELSRVYEPWGGHDNGRQSTQLIEKLIGFAKDILNKYPENAEKGKEIFPEMLTDGCIIFDKSNLY